MDNQPTQSTPPLPSSANSSKTFLIILGTIALMVISGAAGYFLGVNKQSQIYQPPTTTYTTPPTSTPTPMSDETANWKTYKSKYGYSLNYPSNWSVKTENWKEGAIQYEISSDIEAELRYTEPNQPSHGGRPYGTTIMLRVPVSNNQNTSLQEWPKVKIRINDISYTKTENLTIAGIKSIKIDYTWGTSFVFIPYKKNIYEIVNSPFTTEQSPSRNYKNLYDYDQLFRQILSTFKFTQ